VRSPSEAWRFPYSRFRPGQPSQPGVRDAEQAIADTDIYSLPEEVQLDKRVLTEALGVSRTPVREAMTLLEQEGSCARARRAYSSFARPRPRSSK